MKFKLLKVYLLITTITLFCSCNKSKSPETKNLDKVIVKSETSSKNYSMKWGKNEDVYKAKMKSLRKLLRFNEETKKIGASTGAISRLDEEQLPEGGEPCDCGSTSGNTYGFYDDPDNLILEGPYAAANSIPQEDSAKNCAAITSAITSAKDYLNSEGYSDIVFELDTNEDRYKLIHAANALVDLKQQMEPSNPSRVDDIANCFFQAIGYAAIAELSANWASASRQVILRAVGKIATRYLGWFGAAIAVVSFVDCMWG